MAAMTNYLENKLIDAIFRGVSYSFPNSLYIGLFTAIPTASGGGTEVSGGSYGRQSLSPSTSNWAATNAAGSTANPSTGTSGATSNNVPITFPSATASWGTVTSFAIFDGLNGNMLFFGALTSAQSVSTGVVASFSDGTLSVSLN